MDESGHFGQRSRCESWNNSSGDIFLPRSADEPKRRCVSGEFCRDVGSDARTALPGASLHGAAIAAAPRRPRSGNGSQQELFRLGCLAIHVRGPASRSIGMREKGGSGRFNRASPGAGAGFGQAGLEAFREPRYGAALAC